MTTTVTPADQPKSHRGFAHMDLSKQREIASKGGKAAHARGLAHEFTVEEARAAGRKGGQIVSRDRDHMATIGRAGGKARGRNLALKETSTTSHASQAPDDAPTEPRGTVVVDERSDPARRA